MIDWFNLFANSLWIFALSIAFAVVSFARWKAIIHDKRLGEFLSRSKWQTPLNIAGVSFCGGLAATTEVVWERAVWGILAILFLIQIVFTKR